MLAAHESAVAELVAQHEAVVGELQAAATPAEPWASAERHLLFFSGREGYEFVERAGHRLPRATASTYPVVRSS